MFQFYLMYRLICQKPADFLSVQMALVSTFFQMFIALGMYNFVERNLSWTSLLRTKATLANKLEASPTVVEQGLFFTDIKNLLATDPCFDNESRFTNKYSFIFCWMTSISFLKLNRFQERSTYSLY